MCLSVCSQGGWAHVTITHDALDLTMLEPLCTVQGPSRHGQVQPVQLGPHCAGAPLYSTRSLQTWTSSICTTWTSLCRYPSVQYKVPPDMDMFNLYNLDFIVQGPLCTVQGPSRHGHVQSVQLGLHCAGTPLYSARSLQTWTCPICTTWTSLCRDPSVQYKVPPDMDMFNLYNLDFIVQGPLCTVQGPSRHGHVQSVQLGPHCAGTPLYSTRSLQTWTHPICTTWTSLYRDPSVQYKVPPDMDKFNLYNLDFIVQDLSVQYKVPPDMDKFNLSKPEWAALFALGGGVRVQCKLISILLFDVFDFRFRLICN